MPEDIKNVIEDILNKKVTVNIPKLMPDTKWQSQKMQRKSSRITVKENYTSAYYQIMENKNIFKIL